MSKAKSLLSLQELIRVILEDDEKARNSDNYLYLKVLEQQAMQKETNIKNITVSDFLLYAAEWGYSPFESVRRARQKLQNQYPWLAPCKAVEEARAENEKEYKAFALS